LRQADILDVDASYGQFDFIIIHGVYSWVPAHVQKKVLEIFAERLNENGVAYVSYNTYPGWHFRGMIRDVMAYHAKFFDSPEQQLHEARSLVNFLSKTVPVENNPYGLLLSRELELLKDKHSYYLYHEFLEEFNVPLYFHQFAERLEEHGLQYLGEADFSSMSASNFPPNVERMLKGVSDDTIRMEQYMDFVRNRMFR
jgi:SAM-dependent methyltransferase